MKGYYTEYAYVGFMPNGTTQEFVSYEEYKDAYLEALKDC